MTTEIKTISDARIILGDTLTNHLLTKGNDEPQIVDLARDVLTEREDQVETEKRIANTREEVKRIIRKYSESKDTSVTVKGFLDELLDMSSLPEFREFFALPICENTSVFAVRKLRNNR